MGVCGQVITDFFLPQRGAPALDISSTVEHRRSKESKAQAQEPQQSKASKAHMNGSQAQLVSAAWPRPRSQPRLSIPGLAELLLAPGNSKLALALNISPQVRFFLRRAMEMTVVGC